MRKISQWLKDTGADRKASLAPAGSEDLLSEAELERIAASGGPGSGGFGSGGGGSGRN
jgi:hypothetical protein